MPQSFESALIAQSQPRMVAAQLYHLIRGEMEKGCTPEISICPVSLEPRFTPIWGIKNNANSQDQTNFILYPKHSYDCFERLQIWISPDQRFNWSTSESFLKQLYPLKYRAAFEVAGNNKNVLISLLVHKQDLQIILAAFQGQYDHSVLRPFKEAAIFSLTTDWNDVRFRDYFPPPPYSHLLTRPQELKVSPLTSLLTVFSNIKAPAIGLFQVVFQPVPFEHNWHQNVQVLLDFEYNYKLQSGFHAPQRYAQQSPSGDLKQMAWEVENKAHNDKPLFFTAFRLAVLNGEGRAENLLEAITLSMVLSACRKTTLMRAFFPSLWLTKN